MLPLFRDKYKIIYINSLIHHIECEDVYETETRFDMIIRRTTRTVPLANKKVPGLMKENNYAIMIEFVGLRAKMYAVRVDVKEETKKAKGIKGNVVDANDNAVFERRDRNDSPSSCIRSKLHEVYTISESKIALNPYDDKRYVVLDSTEMLWGHW